MHKTTKNYRIKLAEINNNGYTDLDKMRVVLLTNERDYLIAMLRSLRVGLERAHRYASMDGLMCLVDEAIANTVSQGKSFSIAGEYNREIKE